MHGPERLLTPRLILRRPLHRDAAEIYRRYASDPEVTRFLGWPRHATEEDTRGFIEFSDQAWATTPCGPYLIESHDTHTLLGSAGFVFEAARTASVGYLLAKDAWGQGFATEVLRALVDLAHDIGISRLHAYCHPDNTATHRVLEKCGFGLDARQARQMVFPNLGDGGATRIVSYARAAAEGAAV